jgi:hypothetical protein
MSALHHPDLGFIMAVTGVIVTMVVLAVIDEIRHQHRRW